MHIKDIPQKTVRPYINSLKEVFAKMDSMYEDAASHYGLTCAGCTDNCCYTRFYHHTLAEFLYMAEGFLSREKTLREEIEIRAVDVREKTEELDRKGDPVRLLCPLNFEEKCVLYEYRPMICRLHGVPNELHTPGKGVISSPGCEPGSGFFEGKEHYKFDRTPLYIEMAQAEKGLREASGYNQKIKMTVAEMISGFRP